MPPIKTLIFDIGGVLLGIHPEKIFDFWAKVTGLSLKRLHKSVSWDIHYQYETGNRDDFRFYSGINNLLPGENKIYECEFWHGWKLLLGHETPNVDLMESLCETIPILLLPNTNPRHIRYLATSGKYQFYRFITELFIPLKPDEKIYGLI